MYDFTCIEPLVGFTYPFCVDLHCYYFVVQLSMDFEWDDMKASSNYKKHGVRFSEAVTIWNDDNSLELPDSLNPSLDEERFLRLGYSIKMKMLVVVYCEKLDGETIRIISAREATKKEQSEYHSRSL